MRYKLIVSYDGSNYSGFQVQKDKDTIQKRLEGALSVVLKDNISIVGCGRTDAGVSAIESVCHFDVNDEIVVGRTVGYANNILPTDIRIISIEKTDEDFHARFSAKNKTYEYYFYTGGIVPVYEKFAVNIGYNINIDDMIKGAEMFVGKHDFSAFCASNTEVKDKVRNIFSSKIIDLNDGLYKFQICGEGFLYNMVRIIMGTLVSIGRNKIKLTDIKKIIKSKDRSLSGKTMPSKGLYLKKVLY
ncbi:MAG: tRNA pseudouridine(38-40) synthase TruA [Clostridiales bacterium]|nr:tRNA pseudouridine(38-40) synthase TruA [Clostridiales bacterium]